MHRTKKEYGRRNYESKSLVPESKHYIIYEGYKTESRYFNGLKMKREQVPMKSIVQICPLDRKQEYSGFSNPIHYKKPAREIVSGDYLNCKFDKKIDSVWIVIDRDESDKTREQISELIDLDNENKNINLVISNPKFEFWLLLHFEESNSYKKSEIMDLDLNKELKNILPNGYNSSKLKIGSFIDGIELAVKNSKKYEDKNLNKLLDNVGTNLGALMEELFDFD